MTLLSVPSGTTCDIKLDGFRRLAFKNGNSAQFAQRERFPRGEIPGILEAAKELSIDAIIDGEFQCVHYHFSFTIWDGETIDIFTDFQIPGNVDGAKIAADREEKAF